MVPTLWKQLEMRRVAAGLAVGAVLGLVGFLLALGQIGWAAVLVAASLIPAILQVHTTVPLFLLGLILPIYAVGPLGPTTFRAGRLLLLGCILASDTMCRRLNEYRMPNRIWWFYSACLGAAAAIHLSPAGAWMLIGFVAVALVGSRIGSEQALREKLVTGYRVGVFCSAVALLATAAGVSGLSTVTQAGGYAGLTYRSVAFAYTAALAIAFWYTGRSSRLRSDVAFAAWVVEGVVVFAALLASGGRGGLVALAAAVIVLPLLAGHPAMTLRVVAAGCVALAAASFLGLSLITVDRLLQFERDPRVGVVDQYGSGRLDLYNSNLELARDNLVLGAGFEDAGLRGFGVSGPGDTGDGRTVVAGQTSPHMLMLAVVMAGGVGLGLAALVLLTNAAIGAYRVAVGGIPALTWASAGIVVFLVTGLFELGGGLVGLDSILLFSCMVAALERNDDKAPAASFVRASPTTQRAT